MDCLDTALVFTINDIDTLEFREKQIESKGAFSAELRLLQMKPFVIDSPLNNFICFFLQ
jgi:hypothetical protein